MDAAPPSWLRADGALGDERWTAPSFIRALAPSPDGRRLWALTDSGAFAWDVSSGRRTLDLPGSFTGLAAQPHALLLRGADAIERWSYEGERLDPWKPALRSSSAPPLLAAHAEVLVSSQRKALTRTTDAGRSSVDLPFATKIVRASPSGDHVIAFDRDQSSFVALHFDAQGDVQSRQGSAGTRVVDAAPLDDGTCLLAGSGRRIARVRLDTPDVCWIREDVGQGALLLSGDARHALLYTTTEACVVRLSDGVTRASFHRASPYDSWRPGEPPPRTTWQWQPGTTIPVALAPDASWVALEETLTSARCFDADGRALGSSRPIRSLAPYVAWAADGRALFTSNATAPELTEWSCETREPTATLKHTKPSTDRVLPSPDGRHLAVLCRGVGGDDSQIRGLLVLDRVRGSVLADLKTPQGETLWGALHWAPDASALVVLAHDATALWVVPADTWRPHLRWTSKVGFTLLLDVDREAAHLCVLDSLVAVPLRGAEPLAAPAQRPQSHTWLWSPSHTLLVDGTLLGMPTSLAAQQAGVLGSLCRWAPDTRAVRWSMNVAEAPGGLAPSRRWFLTSGAHSLHLRATDDGRLLASWPAPSLLHAALAPRGDAAAWLSCNGVVYRVAIDVDALERSL